MILSTLLLASPAAALQQWPIDVTKEFAVPPVSQTNQGGGFGTQATVGGDNFDRANAGTLGPDWTQQAGSIGILSMQAQSLANMSMATLNGVDDNYANSTVEADFANNGDDLIYIAMVAGFADTSNNIFVKVQDNNFDTLYDRVFFYHGNNGGSWGSTTYYYDLATPTASGHMTLSFDMSGDRAVLAIDNDASGSTETFYGDNVFNVSGTLGTGFGIGTYGDCLADNYSVNGGLGGFTLSISSFTSGTVTDIETSGSAAGNLVIVGYSFAGGGPTSTPYGVVDLTLPITQLPSQVADGSGETSTSLMIPSGAAGRRVWVQAVSIDGGGNAELSNSYAETIL